MAHYALLDENNKVTSVITGRDEYDHVGGVTDWEAYYSEVTGQRVVRTSYNTYGNEHRNGGEPFRGNYAGRGFTYDEENDVFYAPQPFSSWLLNTETWSWEAPVAYPSEVTQMIDGEEHFIIYTWDEDAGDWIAADV